MELLLQWIRHLAVFFENFIESRSAHFTLFALIELADDLLAGSGVENVRELYNIFITAVILHRLLEQPIQTLCVVAGVMDDLDYTQIIEESGEYIFHLLDLDGGLLRADGQVIDQVY